MKAMNLVRVGEAARLLSVSEGTVRRWAKEGRLRVAARLSTGDRLFDRQEVERIAQERRRMFLAGAGPPRRKKEEAAGSNLQPSPAAQGKVPPHIAEDDQ
jgi:excisionase family DNA binding protein